MSIERTESRFERSRIGATVENPRYRLKLKADHEYRPEKEPRNKGSTGKTRVATPEDSHRVRRMEMCLQLSLFPTVL